MTRQPFYAVRIVIRDADGQTSTRDYVRGETRMSREKFSAFALGDMICLVSSPGDTITWNAHEISWETVKENREYHHTTH